jgi:hypothetical protein
VVELVERVAQDRDPLGNRSDFFASERRPPLELACLLR